MSTDQSRSGQNGSKDASAQESVASVSQFLGRVFEQLSLSSWFPAAVLVGNAAVLVQMNASRSLSLGSAIQELTAKPLGIVIVLLFALVIATVVTQAFEFEAIQLLEGYDWARGPGRYLMAARVRRHATKRAKLESEFDRARRVAFAEARQVMENRPGAYGPAVLDAVERRFHGEPLNHLDAGVVKTARSINWRLYAPAEALYQVRELRNRLNRYPTATRLLPTRLGNVMRAAEDELELGEDENLTGFVMRNHDRLPEAIRAEHRTYRARLEMYCTLVLVFVLLAAGSLAMLYGIAEWPVLLAVAAGYLAAGWVAYQAAVASAKGWGDAVAEINLVIKQSRVTNPQAEQHASTQKSGSALRRLRAFFHGDAV